MGKLDQFLELVKKLNENLSPKGKFAIITSLLFLVMIFGYIIFASGRVDYRVLFANLPAEDSALIIEKLKELKIKYTVTGGGTIIKVPSRDVHETRIELAGAGLPQGSGIGFELFDKNSMGMTEFMQKINYRRALQGELGRTISNLRGVDRARVHIVVPERALFEEDKIEPSASVALKLKPGYTLSKNRIAGINHLLASSIEGLNPHSITIIDEHGNVLSAPREEDEFGTEVANSALEYQHNLERKIEKKVGNMLERVVGKGGVSVKVSTELDFRRIEETSEQYDPENIAVRSEQRSEENNQNQGPEIGGVPGAQSNNPSNSVAKIQKGSNSNGQKSNETINYEINRKVIHTFNPVGSIKRLSVAVLLDGTYDTNEEGEVKYIPRNKKDIERFTELVKSTVGFNVQRGDQVRIENIQFNKIDEIGEMDVPFMDTLRESDWIIQSVLYLAALLFALWIGTRFMKWMNSIPKVEILGHDVKPVSEIEAELQKEVEERRLKEIEVHQETRRQVQDFAKQNPEHTAQVMKSWLRGVATEPE